MLNCLRPEARYTTITEQAHSPGIALTQARKLIKVQIIWDSLKKGKTSIENF